MRKVRCVSPHGGAHHGLRADNGQPAHEGYTGPLRLPANEGGWVDNAVLGTVAFGAEVDAPDPPGFIADGFHFVDVAAGAADECRTPGPGCWCGQHRDAPPPPAQALPAPKPAQPAATAEGM